MFRVHHILLLVSLSFAAPAWANPVDLTTWPDTDVVSGSRGTPVSYPSHSPFTL